MIYFAKKKLNIITQPQILKFLINDRIQDLILLLSCNLNRIFSFLNSRYYAFLFGRERLEFSVVEYLANRRSVVNPGTNLCRPPVEVTQIWRPRSPFSFL